MNGSDSTPDRTLHHQRRGAAAVTHQALEFFRLLAEHGLHSSSEVRPVGAFKSLRKPVDPGDPVD